MARASLKGNRKLAVSGGAMQICATRRLPAKRGLCIPGMTFASLAASDLFTIAVARGLRYQQWSLEMANRSSVWRAAPLILRRPCRPRQKK
jgi:hypothetical protein